MATQFAVVGATGTIGREILAALQESDIEAENVHAFASDRSEGEEIEYADETLAAEKLEDDSFRGINVVFLAVPPDAAKKYAPAAQAAGAWVIDVSPAFRLNPDVPLVLPAVNADVLDRPFKGRIIATPSPVTTALLSVLTPLRQAFGVKRVFLTALIGASAAGKRGVRELEKQVVDLLGGREAEPEVFPHRLGFNLIPQVGELEAGRSFEERSWPAEAQRIWQGELPVFGGTAVQVPTFFGHALSISVELGQTPDEAKVRDLLRQSKALKVLDAPDEKVYPMPMLVTADPTVHVGRIRQVPQSPGWFDLFAVIDNAGRGAAWNAVDIALRIGGRKA